MKLGQCGPYRVLVVASLDQCGPLSVDGGKPGLVWSVDSCR